MITSRISIHTTRKVVTMYALSIMGLKYISIHTTRKVVTNKWIKFSREHKISIHTTRKVVTLLAVSTSANGTDFNPHHPQGGDITIRIEITL
mgnify:CR=1 FL=1